WNSSTRVLEGTPVPAVVPPVGFEPTLVTLLGGLPLPLGYEGEPILPAGRMTHFAAPWPDEDTRGPALPRESRTSVSAAFHTVGSPTRGAGKRCSGQLARRSRRPSSTCGWAASSNA